MASPGEQGAPRRVVVVVGAGIAGLYAARQLVKRGVDADVLVLERLMRAGGRLQTAAGRDGRPSHERGAWRVRGARAEALLREAGLTCRPVRPRPRQEAHAADPPRPVADGSLSTYDVLAAAAARGGAADVAAHDKGYHGICARVAGTRVYSAGDGLAPPSYQCVAEGWSALVAWLAKGLDVRHGCLFQGCGADGTVTWTDRLGARHRQRAAAVVLAVPPHNLPRDDPVLGLLRECVQSHPLCHLWLDAGRRVEFADAVTPAAVSQVSANPLQPSDLLHVYAMGEDAFFWQRLHQYQPDRKLLRRVLRQQLRALRPIDGLDGGLDTRRLEVRDVCFWEHGVHSWRPAATFPGPEAATRRAVHPDPVRRPFLWVCGEAFSTAQGWADGALETAELAVQGVVELLSAGELIKPPSPRPPPAANKGGARLTYHGREMRVPAAWLAQHPGGEQAILNHAAERDSDAGALWEATHAGSGVAAATAFWMLEG